MSKHNILRHSGYIFLHNYQIKTVQASQQYKYFRSASGKRKKTTTVWNMAADMQKNNNKTGKPPKKEPQPLIIAKTPAEEQRLRLEKLMRNPDKPAPIPDRPKEWTPRAAPEFVRDVMGSSAGAGSGEFHVYRHLRRREYQRQDFLDKISEKQNKDVDYLEKVEQNKRAAEERTAKRRQKREKLKQKKLAAKKAKQETQNKDEEDGDKSSESSEEEKEEEDREAEDDAEVPSFVMGKKWLSTDNDYHA